MKAKYVSVWDGGTTVTTNCEYDPQTKVVSDIGSAEVEGLDMLDDEYVLLPDGTEIRDFINEDDYEPSETPDEQMGQRFTINLELESFDAKTPIEAVKEALRLMLEWEDGKQSCEGMIYDVTDNITGEKFTVDMSEDDENKVLPNND
jgi:hypothetical protein